MGHTPPHPVSTWSDISHFPLFSLPLCHSPLFFLSLYDWPFTPRFFLSSSPSFPIFWFSSRSWKRGHGTMGTNGLVFGRRWAGWGRHMGVQIHLWHSDWGLTYGVHGWIMGGNYLPQAQRAHAKDRVQVAPLDVSISIRNPECSKSKEQQIIFS